MQLNYSYQTAKGVPGGLADIAPYAIVSRVNGEETAGALKFGMGAVQGTNPGKDILLPDSESAADKFEGVVMTSFTQQQEMYGGIKLQPKAAVGILRYGCAWVRVAPDIAINYGDQLYLVIDGDNAGYFTNDADDGIAVNGRFVSETDNGAIAMVELFNAPAVTV